MGNISQHEGEWEHGLNFQEDASWVLHTKMRENPPWRKSQGLN